MKTKLLARKNLWGIATLAAITALILVFTGFTKETTAQTTVQKAVAFLLVNVEVVTGVQSNLGFVAIMNPNDRGFAVLRTISIHDPVTGNDITGLTLPFTLPLTIPPMTTVYFQANDISGLSFATLPQVGYPTVIEYSLSNSPLPLQFIAGDFVLDVATGTIESEETFDVVSIY